MWGLCSQSHRPWSQLHISYTGLNSSVYSVTWNKLFLPFLLTPKAFCLLHSALHPFLRTRQLWAKPSVMQGKAGVNVKLLWIQPLSSETGCRVSPDTYRIMSRVLQALSTRFLWFVKPHLENEGVPCSLTQRSSEFHHHQPPEHSSDLS